MIIVGCDFHPGWQQVPIFDSATGEIVEQKLENGNGEAGRFYRSLPSPARVGFEACGNTQWFEDLLDSLGDEVCIGDAAEIRAWSAEITSAKIGLLFGTRIDALVTDRCRSEQNRIRAG